MRILYLSLSIVIVDQVSKLLVKGFSIPFLGISHKGMMIGERIPLIGDFFRLTFVENPGMAFGLDLSSGMKLGVSIFSILASIGLVIYLYSVKEQNFSLRFGLALILGGAVGNLIDRVFYGLFYDYAPIFYGKVVDFLDFNFFDFELFGRSYDRWPIFNVADLAVSFGVLTLIFFYKKPELQDEEKEKNSITEEDKDGDGIPDIEQRAINAMNYSVPPSEQSDMDNKEENDDKISTAFSHDNSDDNYDNFTGPGDENLKRDDDGENNNGKKTNN